MLQVSERIENCRTGAQNLNCFCSGSQVCASFLVLCFNPVECSVVYHKDTGI